MLQLVPGDPVMMMLGEFSMATAKDVEALRQQLGFNDPLYIQYWNYFKSLITGDLGTSMRTKKPVIDLILARLPSTFELTFYGLIFALIFGTLLGIIAALKHNTFIDYFTVVIALLGVSIPGFWLALLFIFLFSIRLEWLPITGSSPLSIIMPCLALGLWAGGTIARLVRSGMLEVLQSDYIRTARAKGLYKHRIILVHALRNALLPVVTIFGLQFGHVLAGTVIIEAVFARPGLGLMLVNAIVAKDFPLVQGTIMFVAVAYIAVNILVEVIYTYLDPRIRYS
jgi:ABC-type dipeptide/oligopeptide/nickel transport system permease component|tara:strand:- start:94 stop:942 length:849 start_codon:yes stop_codon:yes gene_type:complete